MYLVNVYILLSVFKLYTVLDSVYLNWTQYLMVSVVAMIMGSY
jgi:hypothetical protein